MNSMNSTFQNLKPRRLRSLLLAAALAAAVLAAGYGATALFGARSPGAPPDRPAAGVPSGAGRVQPSEIAVRSRLVFPIQANLAFEQAGEVAEVLVTEGDRVTAGQPLARLNTDHFPALEEEAARLRYEIAQGQDSIRQLRLDFSDEPLLAARRDETVARLEYANTQARDSLADIDQNYEDALTAARDAREQASLALENATDRWTEATEDLTPEHRQAVARAVRNQADSRVSVDQAQERLEDYLEGLEDGAIEAQDRVTEVALALDLAKDRLEDYLEEQQDGMIGAQDRVTEMELALDLAETALEDLVTEHNRATIRARTRVGAAEVALDAAESAVSGFISSPTRIQTADGRPVDIPRLRRLEASVALAESELEAASSDLAELEEGPDPLRLRQLESNVAVTRLNLSQAREDLTELEDGPDPFRLEELKSNVTLTELNLKQARDNLADFTEGPDRLIVEQLQAELELTRVNLENADRLLEEQLEGPDQLPLRLLKLEADLAGTRFALAERAVTDLLEDGPDREAAALLEREIAARLAEIDQLYEEPDPLQLAAVEAGITLARERVEDIREEMEEAWLRAPFDGVVFMVNVEVDDRVNEYSQVVKLVDPGSVKIAGLVDATNVQFVAPGAAARVQIAALPGLDLSAEVVELAVDPSTERGIISYPVIIDVTLPAGAEVPLRPSAVTAVILP